MKVIQTLIGLETLQVLSELKEYYLKLLPGEGTVTYGYILNRAVHELNHDFLDFSYWTAIQEYKLEFSDTLKIESKSPKSATKFRISRETENLLEHFADALTEIYGSRIRNNFIIKLILKEHLIKIRGIEINKN